MLYMFGDYTLDTQAYALSRAGALVHVRPKVFQVLAYLLAHRDRVVSKRELMEQVWPGQSVSDETLDSCIALARRAVGDSARGQAVIQTRHGYGHRFVAAVEVRSHPPLADATPAMALPSPESPASAWGPGRATAPLPETTLASVPTPAGPPASLPTPYQRLLAGEQKLVTVLVCTLVQAAELAQRLEAEMWHQALQAFYTASLEAVQRYGGTLQHLRDDGILVLFGAPVMQEDHAQRAVRAALGLQQRCRMLHVDVAWPLDKACVVCQGLHTGRMLLGSLGDDGRLTSTAVGDTTQRAAWLAHQAAPGTILLSDATARLVHGEVRLEACPLLPRLGPNDPSPTYQVLGLAPHRAPLLTDGARPRSRFVGRELELATLQALLARVAEGQGQVVGIVGEPGMGKTRLLAEFWQRLGDTRVTSLEGRCVSYGQATPYKPIQDLLRHACGCTEADSSAAITANMQQHLQAIGMASSDAAPFLLHLLGMPDDAALLVGRSPQEIRTQTFAVLHQLLLQESQLQPLLVVVENLHWIDPTSQAYLTELVERLANIPLLLLVTFRPGYRPPWMEKSYATQLALPRLSPEDSRGVVQAVLHPAPVPQSLMQDLLTKAAGNPLFLEELAWTVREHGNLRLPPEVPDTIRAVLAARIDRLPPETKQVLQTAAVIGAEVPVPLLQAVTTLPEETLWQRLHDLHTTEFLYETRAVPDQTYVFKHVLTQEAAYQSLLKRARQEVHQRIAQVLEAAFPETVRQQPEVLALHYTEAGLNARAVGYWQRAGQRANERSAHVEAITHLTRGLDVLITLPDTAERRQHELGLQYALGLALTVTQGWSAPEVERAYTRARELCQEVGEPPQLFPVLLGLRGFFTMRGDLHTSWELGAHLLRLAQRAQDPVFLAAAHYALGSPLYFLGALVRAREFLEQGVALDNPHQYRAPAFLAADVAPGLACRSRVALTLWYLGYPDQALRSMHETLTLVQGLSRPFSLAWTLSFAAIVHQLRREGHATHERAEALHGLARTQGFAAYVMQGTHLRGWAVAMQGHDAEGIAQLQEGLARNRARQEVLMRPYWLTLLADVYGQVGQAEHGLSVLAEALAIVHATGQHVYEAELHRLRGELLLQSGVEELAAGDLPPDAGLQMRYAEAEACFQYALDVSHRQQAKSLELRAAMSLSRLWKRQGKWAEAYGLLAPVYHWFTEGFDTTDLQEGRALLEELGTEG